jgi:hypothetical protein
MTRRDFVLLCIFTTQTALRENAQPYRFWGLLDSCLAALADFLPEDADGGELSSDGRVLEMLSEHTLEVYLITVRRLPGGASHTAPLSLRFLYSFKASNHLGHIQAAPR